MPVPAKHRPKSKTRKNRSHDALQQPTGTTCGQCGKPVRQHYACPACGYYKGRSVVTIKTRTKRGPAKTAAAEE